MSKSTTPRLKQAHRGPVFAADTLAWDNTFPPSDKGAGHVDLYDRVNLIPFDQLTSFFTEHLK